jgi:hypothetical protein
MKRDWMKQVGKKKNKRMEKTARKLKLEKEHKLHK